MHKYSNCFAMLRCGAQPYGTVRLIELSEMVGEHLLHAALLLRLLHNRIRLLQFCRAGVKRGQSTKNRLHGMSLQPR